MFARRENRCRRFQANVFNKSKCQNCFKTVDSHTLSESDLYGTNPVKAGWLLLAPEGINFVSPTHKKRKWQRRYFVLYEHGLLRFALDEMPGTLPQGSVSMFNCCEVLDASSQTGFRNSLQLCFRDRVYYIRTENAESIARWQESLMVYLNAAKSNQRKKRSEHTHAPTEAVKGQMSSITRMPGSPSNTGSCAAGCTGNSSSDGSRGAGGVGVSRCSTGQTSAGVTGTDTCWSKNRRLLEAGSPLPSSPKAGLQGEEEGPVWKGGVFPSSSPSASSVSSCLSSPLSELLPASSTRDVQSRGGLESGYSSLEKIKSDDDDLTSSYPHYRALVIGQLATEHVSDVKDEEYTSSSSEHGCEKINHRTAKVLARAREVFTSTVRRSKSLERSQADPTPTPDLLNFKKGWMTRLGEDGKWRKHWFVLTDQSLRFYRDVLAEEAADLDGEIDLSSCYSITDFPVQKNYGFQIHTKDGVFALCAMTYGIRRNWIQAVMNNVRPAATPDITCSIPKNVSGGTGHKGPAPSDSCQENKRSRISEWRREGRYKTFDWAEFSRKQQKREELSRGAGWEAVCGGAVPPAPASSPEGPIASSIREERAQSEETCPQKGEGCLQDVCVTQAAAPPTSSSTSVTTSRCAPSGSSGVEGVEVCCGNGLQDISTALVKPSSMPALASLSSSSVQTEAQWEELQTVSRDLKVELERTGREFRDAEARLQAELRDGQDRLCEMQSRLQKLQSLLREREGALEEERRRVEDVSGRLRATEEAQALREGRLQTQLRLQQENQERERRIFSDSLDQSERHVRVLEERLQEEALRSAAASGDAEQLQRRCQELQEQLEESDGELVRLRARLRGEETLYYDLEHEYERACEELECVRGALRDCEGAREERYGARLVEQELKEQEHRMVGLEESECRLLEAQRHLQGGLVTRDGPGQTQDLQGSPDGRRIAAGRPGETQTGARGGGSQRVISVMRALEDKLCDSEERLWEITLHLQQQQELGGGDTLGDPPRPGCGSDRTQSSTADIQGVPLDHSEAPDRTAPLGTDHSTLALEALVIRRMASALERPSTELLRCLSELHVQTRDLREARAGEELARFFTLQEGDEGGCTLGENEIVSLCVKSELAYLTFALHTRVLEGTREPGVSERPPEAGPDGVCEQTESRSKLAAGSSPALVAQGELTCVGVCELQGAGVEDLVEELCAHARRLRSLSFQLLPEAADVQVPAELPPPVLRVALIQAALAYVATRAVCERSAARRRMEALFQRYEEKLRESQQAIERAELGCSAAEADAQMRGRDVRRLEAELDEKLLGLQQIHEEEMSRLHEYYSQNWSRVVTSSESSEPGRNVSVTPFKERIGELEAKIKHMEEELQNGESSSLRQAYEQELETLKTTCELGFRSMEQSHHRVVEEMQRQHQMEVERLMKERERALQEEADATIAAIEAIFKAHKEELEKSERAQKNGACTDPSTQHEEELRSLHRELEVLSQQYSQKCLENVHLNQTIETERGALISATREIQDLHTHNQELSKRLVAEFSLMWPAVPGGVECTQLSEGRDLYHLEPQETDSAGLRVVIVRVKNSEIQCLKQEINSLKEELQSANRHSKDLLNELNVLGAKCPGSCVKGRADSCRSRGYRPDVLKSRSNPDLVKDKPKRNLPTRSKSLMDGLSVQERMKLFQSDDCRKM